MTNILEAKTATVIPGHYRREDTGRRLLQSTERARLNCSEKVPDGRDQILWCVHAAGAASSYPGEGYELTWEIPDQDIQILYDA
jgi:hypothetical protein